MASSRKKEAAEEAEGQVVAKATSLRQIEAVLDKKGWSRVVRNLVAIESEIPRLPTGVMMLDMALHGGWPCGAISMIIGNEGCGKTWLMTQAVIQAQKLWPDKIVVYINLEGRGAVDEQWMQHLGVDISKERFKLLEPEYGEMALDLLLAYVEAVDQVSVIIFDSIAAIMPIKERDKDSGEVQPGAQARLMNQATGKLIAKMSEIRNTGKTPPTILFTNQWRMKIVQMGDPNEKPGGKAIRFFSTVIIDISKKEEVVMDDTVKPQIQMRNFNRHTINLKSPRGKTRLGNSYNEIEFNVNFHPRHPWGIPQGKLDDCKTVVTMAQALGVLQGGGGHYRIMLPLPEGMENRERRFKCKLEEVARKLYDEPDYTDLVKEVLVDLNRAKFGKPDVVWKAGSHVAAQDPAPALAEA